MEIYRQSARSNRQKDTVLLARREAIVLRKLGTESIQLSVKRLFSEFEEVEEELHQYLRWHPNHKFERISQILTKEKQFIYKKT